MAGQAEDSLFPEYLCRRCGKCCCEKLIFDDVVLITDIPCEHLDPATRQCRIYPDRNERNRRCLSIRDAIAARALPADCPYTAIVPGYNPPIELKDHPEYQELVDDNFPDRHSL